MENKQNPGSRGLRPAPPEDVSVVGGGEMGALVRFHDWARTPIGAVDKWPQSLRTAVNICLTSRLPMVVLWGDELVLLYNDAYIPLLGTTKHPQSLGQRARDVWTAEWDTLGPMLEGVLSKGEPTWIEDRLLELSRLGYVEKCYFSFSYSPIRDERGGVGGVFIAVSKTTYRDCPLDKILCRKPITNDLGPPITDNNQKSSARILLAVTRADMRDYVKRSLELRYEVETVADAGSAIAQSSDDRFIPDIAIADEAIASLNNFELVRSLRSNPRTQKVPVILLGAGSPEDSFSSPESRTFLQTPDFGQKTLDSSITERKLAELEILKLNQTLERRVKELQTLLEVIPIGIGIAEDPECKNIKVNPAFAKQLGISPDANASFTAPPDQRPQNFKAYKDGRELSLEELPIRYAVTHGVEVQGRELDIVHEDGNIVKLLTYAAPLFDEEGKTRGCVCASLDITERKAVEDALRQSEERFRTLVDSMEEIVFTLDREQRHTGVFGRWLERTNVTPEFFLGKTMRDLLGAREAAIHEAAIKKALCGESVVYEWSELRAIGTQYFQTSLSPLRDANGDAIGIVGVGRNITERRRTEERQRFLSEAIKVLASSLNYATTLKRLAKLAVPAVADYCLIHVVEEVGQIHRVAMAHVDPLKEEMLRDLDQRYPLDFNTEDPVVKVIRTAKSELISDVSESLWAAVAIDAEHLRILRALACKSCMIVPLVARGRTLGSLIFASAQSGRCYCQDDLVQAEDLAHRAAISIDNARLYQQAQEANRMKDEFLSILSHELRTPINAVLGWAQLLRTRKFSEAKTALAIETIERNARSQSQMIEDLLDVSRIIRGKLRLNFAPVELSRVIKAAVDAFLSSAGGGTPPLQGIRLECVLDPEVGQVSGDSNRLQQVVWNLLSNAIKFTPKGGRVEVRLERGTGETLSRPYVEIRVSDTGVGISADFLPYVFERFRQADSSSTRSYGGLGLGLAIARHIVELHGGTVKAESPGKGLGATFIVNLPLLERED